MLCYIWRSVAALWWQAQRSVSVCVCVCVHPCLLIRTCGLSLSVSQSGLCVCTWVGVQERVSRFALPFSLSLSLHCRRRESSVTGWLGEIRCEQRITCSIWLGSAEHHDVSSSLPAGWGTWWRPSLRLSANTHFSPSRSSGSPLYVCVCLCVCLCGEWRGTCACIL